MDKKLAAIKMTIFYSGEENRSLPEHVLELAAVMFTYWLHGQGERPSTRFRRVKRARLKEQRKKYLVRAKAS